MLAVGILTSHAKPCVLRHAGLGVPRVEWRCVVANGSATTHTHVLRTPCLDMPRMSKQRSCACKFAHFTRFAYLRTRAEYIMKTEDDSIVHFETLDAELRRWSSVPMLWMGMFQWAAHSDDGRGRYCGQSRLLYRHPPSGCVVKEARAGTTAPFASGGFDLKRRDLVGLLLRCADYATTSFGACDGGEGHRVARCLPAGEEVHLVDLDWTRFGHRPGNHTLVLHGQKHTRSVHWNATLTRARPAHLTARLVPNARAGSNWSILSWHLAQEG